MTNEFLARLIFAAGLAQVGVLAASALVPHRLNWRDELSSLPRLHRQMYWVYGGYVVLSIVAFASLSLVNSRELAAGGALARGVCAYIAVFWGVRVALQGVFDVEDYVSTWWLKVGYRLLTLLFAFLTATYTIAAVLP